MHKSYLNYIIPSIITSVLSGLYAIVDGFFIGQSIGDNGLSAINIAWPVTALLQATGLAIGIATGVFSSHLKGEGKEKESKKVEGTGIFLLVFFGLFYMVLFFFLITPILKLLGADGVLLVLGEEYLKVIILGSFFQVLGCGLIPLLRNNKKIMLAMIALLLASFVNLLGDYIFISKLNMGLRGAAFASVLGQGIAFVLCVGCLLFSAHKPIYKPCWNYIKNVFKLALSPFILTYSASVLIIITNLICKKYAGTEGVACYTIFSYIIYVVQMVGTGCGDGVQPLISFHFGAKEFNKVRELRKKTMAFTLIIEVCLLVILIFTKNYIPSLFGASEQTIQYFNNGFIYFAIGIVFIGAVRVICSYLAAIKDVTKANLLVILDPFVISPILLVILPLILNIDGVWLSVSVTQAILFILGSYLIRKSDQQYKNIEEMIF